MIKKTIAFILCGLSLCPLIGCGCEHEWVEASCTTPKTCSKCGKTEGEALGHTWIEATCEFPETCRVCSETKGEPLGHQWVAATCKTPQTCSVCHKTKGESLGHNVAQWVETAATCTQKGSRTGVCDRCQETLIEDIPALGHTPGEWKTTIVATSSTVGLKEQFCMICGNKITEEPYYLTGNVFLDAEVQTGTVENGAFREASYAYIYVSKQAAMNTSMDNFVLFVNKRILDSGYAYWSICFEDGTGLVFFNGSNLTFDYGYLREDKFTVTDGEIAMGFLQRDGSYELEYYADIYGW